MNAYCKPHHALPGRICAAWDEGGTPGSLVERLPVADEFARLVQRCQLTLDLDEQESIYRSLERWQDRKSAHSPDQRVRALMTAYDYNNRD